MNPKHLTYLENKSYHQKETFLELGSIIQPHFLKLKIFASHIVRYVFTRNSEDYLEIKSKNEKIILKNTELEQLLFTYPDINLNLLNKFINSIREVSNLFYNYLFSDFFINEKEISLIS